MAEFKTMRDVAAWVEAQPNGLDDLEKAVAENRFGGGARSYAMQYLALTRQEEQEAQAAEDRALRAREVVAAERSAAATELAAAHAKSAARSARIAWYIAAGMLVLSAIVVLASR